MTAGLALISAGRSFGQQLPEMEHEQSPAQAHHQAHLMLDQQHGQLELVADALDQVAELDPFAMVEAGRRLIEQQQPRLCGERARDFDTL